MSDGNRSGGPLAALVAVLALPALALFGLWRFADGRTASTDTSMPPTTLTAPTTDAPAAALTTPLLSFRRVPGLMARDLNGSAFGQQAQAFADTLDATSCLVVALDGVPVATHNPDQPVIPASNQKLPVGAAALAALGPDFAAVIGSNSSVVRQVETSAAAADEPVWELPLAADKYRKLLDSLVADMKYVGGPYAGATTAAIFLSEFVGNVPWAHIDIAGPMNVDGDAGWKSKGATGFGTRLLIDFATTFTPAG